MSETGSVTSSAPEIWFYHLERSTLHQALPVLLEKTLERGWRAVVRASDAALVEDLDQHLWTFRPDSFLAHGRQGDAQAQDQPIWITTGHDTPNGPQALFIVDASDLGDTKGLDRCFILFDGTDETALAQARDRWKSLKAAGHTLAYWAQSPEGRWERRQ